MNSAVYLGSIGKLKKKKNQYEKYIGFYYDDDVCF